MLPTKGRREAGTADPGRPTRRSGLGTAESMNARKALELKQRRGRGRERRFVFPPRGEHSKDAVAVVKVFVLRARAKFFSLLFPGEKTAYLLVWKRGLDHGSLKTAHPLELHLLPQGLQDLHRIAVYGQRFCKQALKKVLKTGFEAFFTWPLAKSILFVQPRE